MWIKDKYGSLINLYKVSRIELEVRESVPSNVFADIIGMDRVTVLFTGSQSEAIAYYEDLSNLLCRGENQ